MVAAIHHRGPDDRGIEVVENAALAHTRLAIVDPTPAGHQPMAHPAGRWWLTYNGEIFNHGELRDQLPSAAYRGGSDTETLLHALQEWGEDAVARCNGLFAFAALDLQRRCLFLVRDRFGVKPLYYAPRPEGLWFASELGALLAAGVPARPRADVLLHGVRHGWANGPLTPVEGVFRVLPGTTVAVDMDTLERRERHWYDPALEVDPEQGRELAGLDREAAADSVEAALRTSVHRRLMADVPVGTMCSGGLDSSLATAFAAEAHPQILAFNASVADQPDADESPWAERVADALGIELLTVPMSAASWRSDLVSVVRHVEYPLMHESSVPMWQIADLARSRGVKVLLSGEGADELFGGYGWTAPELHGDFALRDRPVALASRRAIRRLPRVRDAYWRMRGRPRSPRPPGLLGGDSAEVVAFERAVADRALDAYAHHGGGPRVLLEAHLLQLLGTYLPHLLNRQDKTTMKGSVETREPFLDPDLVALALNLPLELRAEPEPKSLLRDVGRRHLPPEIPERRKVGFGWDYERYLLPAAREDFIADGALRELHGVARDDWRAAVAAPGVWQLPLWTGEIWCRLFLERQSVESVEGDLWRER